MIRDFLVVKDPLADFGHLKVSFSEDLQHLNLSKPS